MKPLGWVVLIALGVFAWLDGLDRGVRQAERQADTQVIILGGQRFAERVEELELERDGLFAKLRGMELRAPQTVYRTDTLFAPPPDARGPVRIELEAGTLSYQEFRLVADSTGGPAYRSEIREDVDIADCERASIGPDGVVCDRNWLGRLGVFGEAGVWDGDPLGVAGITFARHRSAALEVRLFADTEGRRGVLGSWRKNLFAW